MEQLLQWSWCIPASRHITLRRFEDMMGKGDAGAIHCMFFMSEIGSSELRALQCLMTLFCNTGAPQTSPAASGSPLRLLFPLPTHKEIFRITSGTLLYLLQQGSGLSPRAYRAAPRVRATTSDLLDGVPEVGLKLCASGRPSPAQTRRVVNPSTLSRPNAFTTGAEESGARCLQARAGQGGSRGSRGSCRRSRRRERDPARPLDEAS